MQLEKEARIDAVFDAAEKQFRTPKLFENAALADEPVSIMYLALLFVAITDTYKVRERRRKEKKREKREREEKRRGKERGHENAERNYMDPRLLL